MEIDNILTARYIDVNFKSPQVDAVIDRSAD